MSDDSTTIQDNGAFYGPPLGVPEKATLNIKIIHIFLHFFHVNNGSSSPAGDEKMKNDRKLTDDAAINNSAPSLELQFISLAKAIGWGRATEILRQASPEDRAPVQGMVLPEPILTVTSDTSALQQSCACGQEAPEPSISEATMSEDDIVEFFSHAKAHPWKPRGGTSPSAFIEKEFDKWLGRGLQREQIHEAQPNLEIAYASEIGRDPKKRLEKLLERPHQLPAGTPPPPRPPSLRLTAELSDVEKEKRRINARDRKRRSRKKLADNQQAAPIRPKASGGKAHSKPRANPGR